jgi:hypothetical protein
VNLKDVKKQISGIDAFFAPPTDEFIFPDFPANKGSSGKPVPHQVKVFSAISASSAVRLKIHRRDAESAEKNNFKENN